MGQIAPVASPQSMNGVAKWPGEASIQRGVHTVRLWPVTSSCWMVTTTAALRRGLARRCWARLGWKEEELHPACEVQPVNMCSPTARVYLCPVHGCSVFGACVHTTATCGVRRSQTKRRTHFLHMRVHAR
ncbi:unnamed protein product [Triticum aestivum]|uniref:Uncharacterized protein n=4 Tax=Triticinae TaxID=1648030 RepID=A0A9R1ESR7_WHEAT|nr:hypothetical protein CFC21_029574 [Triticum aestivum]SPT17827.1 unnamed protein product [Triticum aestivum]